MKMMKKSLSIILALIMLLSCGCTVLASAADSYDHLPQIYIEGIESKRIYYKDDPTKKGLFYPIDADMLLSNLVKFEDNLQKAIASKNPNLIYAYLYAWMQESYGMIALGKDGYTMSDEVTVDETELNYQGDGKYVFQ